MTEPKPDTSTEDPLKGPKSYFPFIEAKYGRTIEEWIAALRPQAGRKHMEQVAWLKEQGMGHGHAHVFRGEYGGA